MNEQPPKPGSAEEKLNHINELLKKAEEVPAPVAKLEEEKVPSPEKKPIKKLLGKTDLETTTFPDIIQNLLDGTKSATRIHHAKMIREGKIDSPLFKVILEHDLHIDINLKEATELLEIIKKNSENNKKETL